MDVHGLSMDIHDFRVRRLGHDNNFGVFVAVHLFEVGFHVTTGPSASVSKTHSPGLETIRGKVRDAEGGRGKLRQGVETPRGRTTSEGKTQQTIPHAC